MAEPTTPVEPRGRPRINLPLPEFTSFRYQPYRYWWISSATVLLNQTMTQVIMAWLILEITDSRAWVGFTVFAFGLPSFFLLLPAGVLADRGNRRRQLVFGQSVAAINAVVLAIVVGADLITPGLAICFAVVSGFTVAISQPARQSLIPLLVPAEHRLNAIVLGNLSQNLAQFVGPALAGLLIATVSISASLCMLAALLACGILALFKMQLAVPDVSSQRRFQVKDLWGGIAFLTSSRPLMIVVAVYVATGIWVGGALQALVPVLVKDYYHQGSSAFGFAYTVQAVGAVGIALWLTRKGSLKRKGALFACSMLLGGSAVAGYGIAPTYAVALLFFFQFGVATAFYSNMSQSILQTHSPPEVLGRVLSVITLSIQGMIPLGALQAGLLASVFDARITAVYCGLTAVTIGLLAMTNKRFRDLD